MVIHSIFSLFILEDWQIDLHHQTSSCPPCSVTFSRLFHHIQLIGPPIISSIRTPSPWRGRSTQSVYWQSWGVLSSMPSSTSTHMLRMNFLNSVLWLLTSPFLTSTSEASSCKACIHSSMLYAAVGVWVVFVVPRGHPGPLALVPFSMMESAMAQGPSCPVLTIISTWASLSAQLTGPAKWNPTSLALPRGSPSLSDHHPKNWDYLPGG